MNAGGSVCKVVPSPSLNVTQDSLLSDPSILGQVGPLPPIDPGLLALVDSSGECMSRHSLHLALTNQDCCHRHLPDGLGVHLGSLKIQGLWSEQEASLRISVL